MELIVDLTPEELAILQAAIRNGELKQYRIIAAGEIEFDEKEGEGDKKGGDLAVDMAPGFPLDVFDFMQLDMPPGVLLGDIEIIQQIARGRFGSVYKARDLNLGRREVALKVYSLKQSHARAADIMEQVAVYSHLMEQVAVYSQLDCKYFVTTYTAGVAADDGYAWIAMELLEGPNLDERIAVAALPWQEAFAICEQVLRGLENAHEKDIIHGGINPEHIRLARREGSWKILGNWMGRIVHQWARTCGLDDRLARALRYLPWEALRYLPWEAWPSATTDDTHELTVQSDLYAVGLTMYEMLTARRPYQDIPNNFPMTSRGGLLVALGDDPLWQAHRTRCLGNELPEYLQLPPQVRAILVKATACEARDRYQSAQEFRKAIDACLLGFSGTLLADPRTN